MKITKERLVKIILHVANNTRDNWARDYLCWRLEDHGIDATLNDPVLTNIGETSPICPLEFGQRWKYLPSGTVYRLFITCDANYKLYIDCECVPFPDNDDYVKSPSEMLTYLRNENDWKLVDES